MMSPANKITISRFEEGARGGIMVRRFCQPILQPRLIRYDPFSA